jgi:hypothetical protein
MNRRTRRTLIIVAGVLVLLAVAIFLRSKAPPEAARLLPESDGIVYVDIKPIRAFFPKNAKPPTRAPEYQQFVDATGVDWESDLDEVAVALHRMKDPNGPNGPVAYSMVLVGKLTGKRLNDWIEAQSASHESYAGKTIYNITSEDRTVRVAQIGYDMLAVSNTPTAEQIHSIIDRHRAAGLPFSGSSLLERHYHQVPLLSLVWGVGQIGLPFSESGVITVLGLELPLADNSTIVASIAPALPVPGAVRVRVEEIATTELIAESQAAAMKQLLLLAQQVVLPLGDNAANRVLKDLVKTAEVSQQRERVVVTGSVPASALAGVAEGQLAPPVPNPESGINTSR